MPKEKQEKQQATKSGGKTKFYVLLLVAGIGLTVWAVFFKNNKGPAELSDKSANEQTGETLGETGDNYLEGRLEASDDQSRGNLKLVSGSSVIYVRTSRDFSALIGSNVLMYIEGTMEQFRMIDIEKRVERDGYIQQ